MPALGLVFFAVACGVTVAGLLSAIHRLAFGLDRRDAIVGLSFASIPTALWSIVVCTFAGPWLTLTLAWPFWRRGDLASHRMVLIGLIAGIWSFCSGVFVVQAALMAGLLPL